ncbi:hypothetical protein P8452_34317 [Trifolium repens]|nr:hypothetical protein P8452_34317 [Trifolium repens]
MSPPYGDFPSLISHQQIVEEEIESDDEVDQFDSQFLPICASAILQDDFPFDYFERETTRNFLQHYSSKSTSSGMQRPIHDLFDELKMHHQELDTEIGNWLYDFVSNDREDDDDDDDFEEMMKEFDGDDDDDDGEDGDE